MAQRWSDRFWRVEPNSCCEGHASIHCEMLGQLSISGAMFLRKHTVKVLEPAELLDMFPLTPCMFGGKNIVTLKCYIPVRDFSSLLSTTNITDKDTIKVVYIQQPSTITLT